MQKKKFADVPKPSSVLLQLLLILPTPFIFCLLAGYELPATPGSVMIDVGAALFTLLLFVPFVVASMLLLKVFFYGSVMGTKRRVTLRRKNIFTVLFIVCAIPPGAFYQAKAFLWLTNRPPALSFSEMLTNAVFLFLAGLPSFILSLKELRDKIALIKEKELMAKADS